MNKHTPRIGNNKKGPGRPKSRKGGFRKTVKK
jgi:hypothetical protein